MSRFKLSLIRTDYTRGERLVALAISLLVGILATWLFYRDKAKDELTFQHDINQTSLAAFDERAKFDWFRSDLEYQIWEKLSKVRDKLVVLAIDDYSLTLMDWTWPIKRDHYADMVDRLAKNGAETIGLDIIFENRSDFPEADRSLRETLARPEVIVPYRVDTSTTRPIVPHESLLTVTPAEFVARNGFTQEWADADGVMRKAVLVIQVEDRTYYSWDVVIAARIAKKTPAEILGDLSALEKNKLILRETKTGQDRYVEALAYAAPVRFATGAKANTMMDFINPEAAGNQQLLPGVYKMEDTSKDESHATLDQILIYAPISALWTSVDDGGYVGAEGGLVGTQVDASGKPVLDANGKPKPLPCTAIVGVTSTAGYDLKMTPVGKMSGLDMHAYTIASLLTNSFFRSPPAWLIALFFCFCSLLAGLLISTLGFRSATIGFFLACGASILVTRTLYLNSIVWPLYPPLVCMAVSFLLVNVAHVLSRNRRIAQRDATIRQVQNIIRELTPVDMEDLLANNGLQLGGKATELTVLFSDLRGYTSMAEKLTSVEVIDRLNDYFALLGPILERYGGAVFDYQGDALMAVFGLKGPSQPNHAAAGCKAGAAIIYALEKQRKEWLKQGRPMPETGIGLCTGLVAFGGLGTAQHKQYVAIGDPTNTASRMQGKSKELDSPVLITESTYEMALKDESVVMRYLEEVELKGKREPLKVYEVSVDETAAKLDLVAKVAPGEALDPKAEPIL